MSKEKIYLQTRSSICLVAGDRGAAIFTLPIAPGWPVYRSETGDTSARQRDKGALSSYHATLAISRLNGPFPSSVESPRVPLGDTSDR